MFVWESKTRRVEEAHLSCCEEEVQYVLPEDGRVNSNAWVRERKKEREWDCGDCESTAGYQC